MEKCFSFKVIIYNVSWRKRLLVPDTRLKIPYVLTYTHRYNEFFICCLTDLAVLIKHSRVPCLAIQSIHPVLDTRAVHIVLCIHHLLLLFNNNTNSLLLRRLLWDWLVASQERWVCTKLPMYVLSTFLLILPHNCCTTVYIIEVEIRVFGIRVSQKGRRSLVFRVLCACQTPLRRLFYISSVVIFRFSSCISSYVKATRSHEHPMYNLLH